MQLPNGVTQRCLQAAAVYGLACILASCVLGCGRFEFFIYLTLITIPVVVLYSLVKINPRNKAVLVTGCDTGFGFALAKRLHDLGFFVFAGCLLKDKDGDGAKQLEANGRITGRLIPVQLDITSDDQVEAAVRLVRGKLPSDIKGLWAVVNNAGYSTFGEVEWVPMSVYEMVASINVFGTIRVTKGFLPLIREAHGRVVNVASILGRMASNGRSPYCATKFAVEAFSDCLRLEMKKFNVNVSVIEPGNFIAGTSIYNADMVKATSKRMWDSMSDEVRNAYGQEYFDKNISLMLSYTTAGVSDVSPVIDAMTDAVVRRFPRNRYQPMAFYEIAKVAVATHLPEFVFDYLIG